MSEEFRSQALDKVKYSVRASQAIIQYGVGALVDFQDQTLMTGMPDSWENNPPIHDERLEKLLDVKCFRGFTSDWNNPLVSYVRFPEWYFCPKCRRFKSLKLWTNEYRNRARRKTVDSDPDMVRNLKCYKCGGVPLVASRIVSICSEGHIDDFPWINWVHAKSKRPVCTNKELKLYSSSSAADGLDSLQVKCACGAYATLSGAFNTNSIKEMDEKTNGTYNLKCSGFHPWKNQHENCKCYPKAVPRGSSSVYFPYVISSLVIPPYSSRVTNLVDNSRHYEDFRSRVSDIIDDARSYDEPEDLVQRKIADAITKFSAGISKETGVPSEEVKSILIRKITKGPQTVESNDKTFKYEEYTALNGEQPVMKDAGCDFVREGMSVDEYAIPYLKSIALIHKVREVRVLRGFTRSEPVEKSIDSKDSERIVSVKADNWYPASEVRGEGIFLEFDNDAISKWIKRYPTVADRSESLTSRFKESFFGKNSDRKITPKYLMLHTLSHLLIKELSSACGYNIASLQERIYCAEKHNDGFDMQGIFIYTAGGDSEGTLGGLVRQGKPDIFSRVFKTALENAVLCSNDPICSLSKGQGRDSLNLAACHTCCLIPETSCEENNVFLDRSVLVGNFDNRNMGFYSSLVYEKNDDSQEIFETQIDAVPTSKVNLFIEQKGNSLQSIEYVKIFKDLLVDSTGVELENINKILANDMLKTIENKPYGTTDFRLEGSSEILSCELIWPDAQVMYFSECSEYEYSIAKESGWKCFYAGSTDFDVDIFLNSIKENA